MEKSAALLALLLVFGPPIACLVVAGGGYVILVYVAGRDDLKLHIAWGPVLWVAVHLLAVFALAGAIGFWPR